MAAQHDRTNRRGKRRGFRQAAGALEPLLKKAAAGRGFAERRLLTDWAEIAGAEAARLCRPRRIRWGRRGQGAGASLEVEAWGAAAMELAHLEPLLVERVNAALGWRAVNKLKILRGTALAEPPARYQPPPAPQPRLEPGAARLISAVKDDEYREKLARLGLNLARARQTGREPT